ncbi:MAG: HNH endonuclease signature motif containing protein [Anaerolineales bacterium]
MNNKLSRPTPDAIARQLRQESGFGCCKCGHPIFQYHHIVPFGEEEHFRPEDMMVLCPNCHDEATQGAMPEKDQRKYKSHPYNKRRGFAQGLLTINDYGLLIRLGNNYFKGGGSIIQMDGNDIVRVGIHPEGFLELTTYLYNQQDDLLVSIVKNEWISGNVEPWDIEFKYRWLRIRERRGKINLTVDARKSPTNITAKLWRFGHLVYADSNILRIDRHGLNCGFTSCTFTRRCIDFQTKPEMAVHIK